MHIMSSCVFGMCMCAYVWYVCMCMCLCMSIYMWMCLRLHACASPFIERNIRKLWFCKHERKFANVSQTFANVMCFFFSSLKKLIIILSLLIRKKKSSYFLKFLNILLDLPFFLAGNILLVIYQSRMHKSFSIVKVWLVLCLHLYPFICAYV
jgi:hypothetical protein